MSSAVVPPLPPRAPRLNVHFWRWFCRGLLQLAGWRLVGTLPDLPRLVVIGAPHSSYWDGVWGLLMRTALGLDINIMIKREVLDGPLGVVLRPLGMIPIDRGAAKDVVTQMRERFASHPRMWLGIAPEGTRKPVAQWKTGFLRIAGAAGVPVLPVFMDYPNRRFVLGEPIQPSDDAEADMARIRALFAPYRGKHRGA